MSTVTAKPATPPAAGGARKGKMSDRSVAENRLGQKLVAPAVLVMLLVTAWPMIQALYLSLFRYRLTTPDDKEFTARVPGYEFQIVHAEVRVDETVIA